MKLHAPLPDGTKIVLRPPTEADIQTIFEAALASRAELAPWMPWCGDDFNIEVAEKWVKETTASDAERSFTVWDEREQCFFGNCALHGINTKSRSAVLGYWVRTDQVGRGIASAATRALAEYGFNQLELVRVEILIAVGNDASTRVAERVGASCEGTLRNRLIHRDLVRDARVYSLIPSDFGSQLKH